MPSLPPLRLAVIGAGPRGLSVLERLCANTRGLPRRPVVVHLADPYRPGAGRVWRTDQSPHLLMNTVACQITLFTDASVTVDGPVEPGPSLYEWAQMLPVIEQFERYDRAVLEEARNLEPDAYPSRAFYGRYLEWAYRRVVGAAPDHLAVRVRRQGAVALADQPDGRQAVRLADGSVIGNLDAVILALGHTPVQPAGPERDRAAFAAEHGLTHLGPMNPADADLSAIAPGEPAILLGLGLNCFDYLALLTSGRGGVFVREDDRLRYRPSGLEPKLFAASRRGVPYHARGENQKGPHARHLPILLGPDALETLREDGIARDGLEFGRDIWPLVAAEVEAVFYTTLLRSLGRGGDAERFLHRFLAARIPTPGGSARPPGDPAAAPAEAALLDCFGIGPEDRWDWSRTADPLRGRSFAAPGDFRRWLLGHLRADAREACAGNVRGPLKAALDVLRDLRNEVRILTDHGRLSAASHRDELYGWYTPLNAFLSIGPPARRIEEMAALIEAGVLDVIGPGVSVALDRSAPAFVASSPAVAGSAVRARTLIEARLPEPDLRRTADPLLADLKDAGQCRPYRVGRDARTAHETGGLEVTERPYHLVDARGRPHPRRFAYGVPTESVHWVTAAGVRPGVDSVTLGDSDAIARAALALASGHRRPEPVRAAV